jgi:hypothetical protein
VTLPSDLRARVAADYTAVRPLPSPLLRALAVTPFAILALLAAPAYFDVRADATALGWLLTWGASLLQVTAGFTLIAAALRESVPGRSWTPAQLALWIIAPLLLVVVVTFASAAVSALPLGRGWWRVGLVCLGGSAAMALPIVALANVLAVRAYPTRPAVAGLLAGLGAGLMADAGWRIFCHYGEPAHVLSAHLGGVMLAAAAGAVLALTLRKPFR